MDRRRACQDAGESAASLAVGFASRKILARVFRATEQRKREVPGSL